MSKRYEDRPLIHKRVQELQKDYDRTMIFKRVLHPIEQGAFFTEQFYDENDVNIFTVTYDCGEKNSNKHLEREIDNTLYPTGQPVEIDLMFISQLG